MISTKDENTQRPAAPPRLRLLLALAGVALVSVAFAAPAQALPRHFYGTVLQGGLFAEDYRLMGRGDVGTLRLQLGWPMVQKTEGRCQAGAETGNCDWRAFDQVIGTAASRGVEVFPYLLNVPPYIDSDPETPPVRNKRAREGWKDFARAAAKRYGRGGTYWKFFYPAQHPGEAALPIRHWQIWNEPSAAPFWDPKPKPREYAKLVKLTSKAITGADRKAYIVLAGLFGTPVEEIGGIRQDRFLRKIYKTKKIKRFFDAVAIHPYGPDLARVRIQVKWALREMRRAKDRKAGLWISEIGWASDRSHNQLGVGKKGQAKMLRKSFRMFKKKRKNWNIKAVNWYAWQDNDGEGYCDFCHRSGLVTESREPKLSYRAFKKLSGG